MVLPIPRLSALLHPELFGYVGLFSPYINLGAWDDKRPLLEKIAQDGDFRKNMDRLFRSHPDLYWIGIGKADQFYGTTSDLRRYLDSGEYPYVYMETTGGHNWTNWRIYLDEFLRHVFK
ncbi:MAG: hypothetical protein IJ255_06075 [Bacteroidales bacterium]|nr:hypothetical protein [Bacteroidales bacterium]